MATAITVSERHVLVSPGKTAPRGEGYVVSSRDRHPTPSILPKPLLRAKVVQALHTALADRQLRARRQAGLLLRRVRPRRAARPALRPPFEGCLPRGLGRCLPALLLLLDLGRRHQVLGTFPPARLSRGVPAGRCCSAADGRLNRHLRNTMAGHHAAFTALLCARRDLDPPEASRSACPSSTPVYCRLARDAPTTTSSAPSPVSPPRAPSSAASNSVARTSCAVPTSHSKPIIPAPPLVHDRLARQPPVFLIVEPWRRTNNTIRTLRDTNTSPCASLSSGTA